MQGRRAVRREVIAAPPVRSDGLRRLTPMPADHREDEVTLVLVHGAEEVCLGPVQRGDRCGLGFIDDLLRLQVAVRRFGWSLRVDDVPVELHELLELTGLRPHVSR
jgi:hypothetical protein